MLRNYFKIAYRNLVKNKLFSLINIMGLAIGLTCSIIILLWVQDELSYDKFHKNHNRIFRVLQEMPFTEKVNWAINQGPLAPALKADIPEIEDASRVAYGGWRIRYADEQFTENGIYVDPSFFNIFSFEILEGDINTALADTYSVLVTEDMAGKLFGDEPAIGKSIRLYDNFDVVITGVLKNPPLNSHLRFNFISTMLLAKEVGYSVERWNNSTFNTYMLIAGNSSSELVSQKIYNFLDDKPTLEDGAKLSLQPLSEIHLGSGIDFDNGGNGNIQYVIIFFSASLFILLIACINFMNLSTAQAQKRAKEVGLRKAIGANQLQLIKQFLMESTLLALISIIIAIISVELILPYFNGFTGKEMNINYLDTGFILSFSSLLLLTGILAGSYSAFFLSKYKPIKVLKGDVDKRSGNTGIRKALVVLQFTISIILLTGTLAVYKQVNFLRNKDLGFNKENLLYISLNRNNRKHLNALKTEMLRSENIVSAAGSTNFSGYSFSNNQWNWEGKGPENDILFRATYIDYNYLETFEISMLDGRSFSKDFPGDTLAVVLNQTAIDLMGLEDPVGKSLNSMNINIQYKIVGIANDYNYRSLHSEIEPLLLFLRPSQSNFLWLRVSSENIQETIKYAGVKWDEIAPDDEFSYGFLDQRMENTYQTEERIGFILNAFSILAMVVLCLGLFGLLGYSVRLKFKEISVRKILGATTSSILMLLSKDYSQLLVIAIVIAIPTSNYFINLWLNEFPFRTNINFMLFLLPSLLLIVVASLIILGQSYKASQVNAAETLRNE